MGTTESVILQNAQWALPIISNYLDYDDILELSKNSDYIKELLTIILSQRRTYYSSDFVKMSSYKSMHMRT